MEITKKPLNIGPYELIEIPTGEFALDGGAMFGTVPKVLWEKSNPPDDKNRIPMEARALCLKSQDRIILIDTGNGGDFVEKHGEKLGTTFAKMYGVHPDQGVVASLKKNEILPEDITDVILTHLHFDHVGGATRALDGKLVPTFPNAKYYVQKENLQEAQNPNIRERASYLSPNFTPLIEHNVLVELEGSITNFLPHIDLIVTYGHTRAQQILRISDSNTGLFYCADLVPTSSHIRSAWVMGYDLHPLTVIEEKGKVLQEAFEKGYFLYYEHDPYCAYSTVVEDRSNYKAGERFHL